jgi:hypothetical protein
LYTNVAEYMPLEDLKEGGHPTLADKLVDDWGIFNNFTEARNFLNVCCGPYHPKYNPGPDIFNPDQPVGVEELFFDIDYHETSRLLELWHEFRVELATGNRFFAGKNIIRGLEVTLPNAVVSLPAKTVLYRARVCEAKKPYPKSEMGAPPADRATAGRANPAGISYLYMASNDKTAASELRPHVGDSLAVGTFKLHKSLNVVDLRRPSVGSPFRWGDKLPQVLRTRGFLRKLGEELSRPIGSTRRELDYLPTQYLCEFLKSKDYAGILYKSGLGNGYNVALFDPAGARCTRVVEVVVKTVDVVITEAGEK